jgi:hypothetical protein
MIGLPTKIESQLKKSNDSTENENIFHSIKYEITSSCFETAQSRMVSSGDQISEITGKSTPLFALS